MYLDDQPLRVVSNSSPLINLATIDQLRLLEEFFAVVWIPDAVWHECVVEGAGKPGAAAIGAATFLKQRQPQNTPLIRLLQQRLDAGESESLALAVEMHSDWLLLDERDARDVAAVYGLRTTGVIGLLLRAQQFPLPAILHPAYRAGWATVRIWRQGAEGRVPETWGFAPHDSQNLRKRHGNLGLLQENHRPGMTGQRSYFHSFSPLVSCAGRPAHGPTVFKTNH